MDSLGAALTPLQAVQRRAELYQYIRRFFQERNILEVSTPIFSPYANTDPYIESISAEFNNTLYYAHTSPEFSMKRLLCAGSGSIYQLSKVFRREEQGRHHSSEFTMLEWYELDVDYKTLSRHVIELCNAVGYSAEPNFFTYQELFQQYLHIDVFQSDASTLKACAHKHNLMDCDFVDDIDGWLNYLLTHIIEPQIKVIPLLVVYDYPASQAALAQISNENPHVARRFEVYLQGIELANGYQELQDADAYAQRFAQENAKRLAKGLSLMPIDSELLTALSKQPLPSCSGVALGVDRLLMLLCSSKSLSDIEFFSSHE